MTALAGRRNEQSQFDPNLSRDSLFERSTELQSLRPPIMPPKPRIPSFARLDQQIRREISLAVSQLDFHMPALDETTWYTLALSENDDLRGRYFVQGKAFLHSEFTTSYYCRPSPGPVSCFLAIESAVLSLPTVITLTGHRANLATFGTTNTFQAFVIFIGAALTSLGEGVMKDWFAENLAPLIAPAEAAYLEYYPREMRLPANQGNVANILQYSEGLDCLSFFRSKQRQRRRIHGRRVAGAASNPAQPCLLSQLLIGAMAVLTAAHLPVAFYIASLGSERLAPTPTTTT
ncbi:hypothetical protein B0H17DRAFT_165041 [Mycena rosella]|uniref:Uncharacterized protein n=1 Tax=Mycena rosella TaxID=1033263 RepID=A0AAD7DY90_MYCRO|nr:hypothetical protein B0H17DRAFT_165041 [Mycena rosella]